MDAIEFGICLVIREASFFCMHNSFHRTVSVNDQVLNVTVEPDVF